MSFSQADEWAFKMAVAVVQVGKIPDYRGDDLDSKVRTAADFITGLHKELAAFYRTLPRSGESNSAS